MWSRSGGRMILGSSAHVTCAADIKLKGTSSLGCIIMLF